MKKIGIFSGTFDPIHKGHVMFAKEALEQIGLDKIFFLVEPSPRRKQGVKAFDHRVAMVNLALKPEPKLASIVLNHAQFSVLETLPALQARFKYNEIHFLMGDDMLNHFTDDQWPHIDEFVRAFRLIIGVRKSSAKNIEEKITLIEKTRGIKMQYQTFNTSLPLSSSSRVRTELRKGQHPSEIDDSVWKYIKKENLYSPATDL